MASRNEAIEVEGGAIPVAVLGPDDAHALPALFVVPSIFGPAPDLLKQLEAVCDRALVVVPDPFWRVGGGVVPYSDHDGAIGRLKGFDLRRCIDDLGTALDWSAAHSNGRVVGLGICFGGPFVLRFAAEKRLAGGVTWHGSRMENHLERAGEIRCPLRLHFGEADPISPPEAIEKIRTAFANHPDVEFVVHPGLVHGYSHEGDAYDEAAARAGVAALRDLLGRAAAPGAT